MTSIKVITDRKFMSFFEKNPIENVSVCDATKLGSDKEIGSVGKLNDELQGTEAAMDGGRAAY